MRKTSVNHSAGGPDRMSSAGKDRISSPSLSPAPKTRKSTSRRSDAADSDAGAGDAAFLLSPSEGNSNGGGLSAATALLMTKGQSCSGYLHKLPVERSAPQTGGIGGGGAGAGAGGGVGVSGGKSGKKMPATRRGTDLTRRWTKRWFTLRGSTLEYRSSKDSKTVKGSLVLSDGSICSEVDNSKSVFEIWTFNGTILLRADGEADKQRWLRALRAVCKIRTMTDQGLTDNSPQKQKHRNSATASGAASSSGSGGGALAQKPLVDYRRRKAMLKVASGTFLLLLPQIVRDLVDWLVKHGLDHEGLFRVSADAVAISKLLQDYHDREADADRVKALLDGMYDAVCVPASVCVCVRLSVSVCVCVYAFLCLCMYVCLCVHGPSNL